MIRHHPSKPNYGHKKIIITLVIFAFGMFGFCYALVPLYNTFCQYTGLQGKLSTGRTRLTHELTIDKKRSITVEFTTQVNQNIPWKFYSLRKSITLHPGELKKVLFYAENISDNNTIGQAIPSISPGLAASYFHKTQCFCFNRQLLKKKAHVVMPVVFYLDQALPNDIPRITLSYTLFKAQSNALPLNTNV